MTDPAEIRAEGRRSLRQTTRVWMEGWLWEHVDVLLANYLPSAAPVPEGVPEDHRVCSHGIYHHGCLSCDRQDPEERL